MSTIVWSRQWKWTEFSGIYNMEIKYQVGGINKFRYGNSLKFIFVSLYSSQIILYRSLHAYQWSILKSTIWEISYLGSPSIITSTVTSCVLLEKKLDMAGSSIDIWKTGWIEYIDSGRWRINDSVPGWAMIL